MFFETGSCYMAQVGLELMILLLFSVQSARIIGIHCSGDDLCGQNPHRSNYSKKVFFFFSCPRVLKARPIGFSLKLYSKSDHFSLTSNSTPLYSNSTDYYKVSSCRAGFLLPCLFSIQQLVISSINQMSPYCTKPFICPSLKIGSILLTCYLFTWPYLPPLFLSNSLNRSSSYILKGLCI
jgi:hypothetical protein